MAIYLTSASTSGTIERRWGASIILPKPISSENSDDNEFEEYEDEAMRVIPDIEDTVGVNGKLLNQQPVYNKMLHSEVSHLQLGDTIHEFPD